MMPRDLAGRMRRLRRGLDIQFDAYCVHCGQMSTFRERVMRGSGAGMVTPTNESYLKDSIFSLELFCQRNENHQYFYVIEVFRQSIQKIGQSPSIADIAHAQFNRYDAVLDKAYVKELKSAAGLFAHGIGIGSFVYCGEYSKKYSLMREMQRGRKGWHSKNMRRSGSMTRSRC